MALEFAAIRDAHKRIRDKVNRTPIMTSEALDALSGAQLFFKCENLQNAGAFKARGATNAVFLLTDEQAKRGVVTHSSGNHAAALARAARLRGIPAYIVMPSSVPKAKKASVERYGGKVILCEPTMQARESTAKEWEERTGAEFIHPYNDLRVMAGQGTTAIEILEDVPDLDMVLCPVGGGGQLSGVAVASKALRPEIAVIGVEPAGADDAFRSFHGGKLVLPTNPRSVADGLLTTLGPNPFAEFQRHVTDIVTVSEEGIVNAMRTIWEVLKLVVEASGAVPYAAVVENRLDIKGKRVALILSGGNLDLDLLPWQRRS